MKTNPILSVLSVLFLVLSSHAFAASNPIGASACVAALNHFDSSIVTSNGHGATLHGFDLASYEEGAPTRASIILENTSQVFFYSEDCDIGATIYVCDKATATVSQFASDHELSCADLPAQNPSNVIYSSCAAN